jgi:acetate kinase
MRILVVNAGSSSLKLRFLGADDALLGSTDLPALGTEPSDPALLALEAAVRAFGGVDVVGHRIVHGGTEFTGPATIDSHVRAQIGALADLAPLHQPKSIAALDAVSSILPTVTAVACFDTSFHATIPPAASTYALPAEWRTRWPLRRFGFHGLSHAYAARRTAELLQRPQEGLRLVTCHLGAGASLAAVRGGRSQDTTMGFTPLEGLAMATRSGTVDPGLILWLVEHQGIAPAEISDGLEHRSGLLGLAGTADMRAVVDRTALADPAAELALSVYLHRLRAGIAAMAAALGGIDALTFTGGVGEGSPLVRSAAAEGLGFLGIGLEAGRNRDTQPVDREIGRTGAAVRSFVIAAREDLEIARQVRQVLETS